MSSQPFPAEVQYVSFIDIPEFQTSLKEKKEKAKADAEEAKAKAKADADADAKTSFFGVLLYNIAFAFIIKS